VRDKTEAGRSAAGVASLGLRFGAAAAVFASVLSSASAHAAPLLGQPTPYGIGFQPAGDGLKRSVIFFHDDILLPIITAISLFVLGLLIYVCVRFNKRANPTPSRFTHNTTVEVIWTAAPVLMLLFIAIFSFRLLYAYHDMPNPDMTVKVTGNQWYWNYTYPDNGAFTYDSLILPEAKAKAVGKPYRLGVDNPLVVPEGAVVRVLVTGADVIHDFALPAFGLKTDAIPGKVNQTWFKAERPGVYYGQCSELCGVDHAFMPIEIDVVPTAKFNSWVLGHSGGKLNAKTLGMGANTPNAAPVQSAAPTMPGGATVGPTTGAPASPVAAPAPPPAAQTTRPAKGSDSATSPASPASGG
jgi:cytochrome c oxidase subunit II